MGNKEEFLRKILATFISEATEGIEKISTSLLELEKDQPGINRNELLETAYREAHSLKGASRAVNLIEFESVCQALEGVFSNIQKQSLSFTPALFDLLHNTCNLFNELLAVNAGEIPQVLKNRVALHISELSSAESGNNKLSESNAAAATIDQHALAGSQSELPPKNSSGPTENIVTQEPGKEVKKTGMETVRVSTGKIDDLLAQVEELLTLKQTSSHITDDIRSSMLKLKSWEKESTEVYTSLFELRQKYGEMAPGQNLSREEQHIAQLLQFYNWEHSLLKTLQNDLEHVFRFSEEAAYETGMKIESLLLDVKEIVSLPFFTILSGFPKTCRDLSRDKGKEIELQIEGDQIEIDRRVLEEIRNPLLHLLRNCIDHGIEKPGLRELRNKPLRGIITILIERLENSRVEITVSDDGSGINLDKLRKQIIRQEKISAEEAGEIADEQVVQYIFKSGISTSDLITDLSGRGLGLAIVREKIELLGGTITVKTVNGQGTEFKIQIPLSMATFRGIIIRCGANKFAVSTTKVEKVIQVEPKEIGTIRNKAAIPYDGNFIPLVDLAEILELPKTEQAGGALQVLVLGSYGNKIGFIIDEVINEEEILLKNFNAHLRRIRNVSGATLLGSGEVIVILNVSDLIKTASGSGQKPAFESPGQVVAPKQSVLVVEDSITSRMLLKNILEGAGYDVTTAIDGVDGFFKLKKDPFNLVISDVDMPRMNGFDLTAKIRSDPALMGIPLILVTSLSKEEDRARGMEVGANAYIVKSNFDQSTLLDVIDRLIS